MPACGVSASPTPNWGGDTQIHDSSPGPGERCALTSSDLSSSLGLVLRKWKTVSQGVRSRSGLGVLTLMDWEGGAGGP